MDKIIIERNVMVPMRDGVRLATDIYRKDDSGPAPVLMARTPYNKNYAAVDDRFDTFRALEMGYAVVIQDVRGRYASEGKFNPHFQEKEDGVDAFAWASGQPWSDGTIGTFGGSYLGGTQWLPAGETPPALKAMAPSITFSDSYEGCMYQGGAKVLHDLRWVVASIIPAELNRSRTEEDGIGEKGPLPDVDEALNELPLAAHPMIASHASFYREWLSHSSGGEYWHGASPEKGYEGITVPALNISGWYDIFLWSTFRNFTGMRERGGSKTARENQRVIIGPWTHMNFSGVFPEIEYGSGSSAAAIDLAGMHMRWYDRWVRGIENGAEKDPPVMIFLMGRNEWIFGSDWPLPDTRFRSYYLHSSGSANTLHGDGALSADTPGDEPSDVYLYNPLRPVPTVGGQVILPGGNSTGPRDQREAEIRDDVLVYSTPVLDKEWEVIGPVELQLYVSSSARDTDFTGKLVDVFPDGKAVILTEGIMRARYRNSFERPEMMEPGEIYGLTLNLWATANVFLPGHSVRLEVSSSNFPRFDRNSNTGGTISGETRDEYMTAVNRIHHDGAHPSRLILPIREN